MYVTSKSAARLVLFTIVSLSYAPLRCVRALSSLFCGAIWSWHFCDGTGKRRARTRVVSPVTGERRLYTMMSLAVVEGASAFCDLAFYGS